MQSLNLSEMNYQTNKGPNPEGHSPLVCPVSGRTGGGTFRQTDDFPPPLSSVRPGARPALNHHNVVMLAPGHNYHRVVLVKMIGFPYHATPNATLFEGCRMGVAGVALTPQLIEIINEKVSHGYATLLDRPIKCRVAPPSL